MFYSIRHLTKFRYSSPVSESIMELRMQPRSEGAQRCLSFEVTVTPRTRVQTYRDHLGNVVQHFDVPGLHRQLMIVAEAAVDVASATEIPPQRLGEDAWQQMDAQLRTGDFWEMLAPSTFADWTEAIAAFGRELQLPSREAARKQDPLELVTQLNSSIYRAIEYGRCAAASQRRMPGLLAHYDRAGAQPGNPVPLRERIFISSRGRKRPIDAGRDARVGGDVFPGPRLDRIRSDQQYSSG
jgi:hypothetical protein